MPKSNECLKSHRDEINKILFDNKSYFCKGVSTVVRFKENPLKKGEYEIKHNSLFLKSEEKEIVPYLEIQETWINDEMVGYMYRFEIPFFEYCFACRGSDKKVGYEKFAFRYESHYDMPDHKPKDHLHVLDHVPPRYNTYKPIEFKDFLDIIIRDFIQGNRIKFEY